MMTYGIIKIQVDDYVLKGLRAVLKKKKIVKQLQFAASRSACSDLRIDLAVRLMHNTGIWMSYSNHAIQKAMCGPPRLP